jgi:hypothetical protein
MTPHDALRQAAARGDIGGIQSALATGRAGDLNGALIAACRRGQVEAAAYLLDCGANPHTRDRLPQREALDGGHWQIVQLFAERGAIPSHFLNRFVREAARQGWHEIVYLLLQQGANPHQAVYAALAGRHLETLLIILDYDKKFSDGLVFEVFKIAIEKQNQESIKYFFRRSGNFEKGKSFLYAISTGNMLTAHEFLNMGLRPEDVSQARHLNWLTPEVKKDKRIYDFLTEAGFKYWKPPQKTSAPISVISKNKQTTSMSIFIKNSYNYSQPKFIEYPEIKFIAVLIFLLMMWIGMIILSQISN